MKILHALTAIIALTLALLAAAPADAGGWRNRNACYQAWDNWGREITICPTCEQQWQPGCPDYGGWNNNRQYGDYEEQPQRHHRHSRNTNDGAAAVGAIMGLALGAIIANQPHNNRHRYYDDGY